MHLAKSSASTAPVDVLDAIERRRAVRSYTEDVVPRDVVETLVHAAVYAPTAMHAEPWQFVIVQDRALLARISERAKQLAPPNPLLHDPAYNIFYDAGTLIVICARAQNPFVSADCWLAAQNLMLAAYALGYATCPIGFAIPALDDPEVKRWLGIPRDVVGIAPIIVGVPRGEAPGPARRDPVVLAWK